MSGARTSYRVLGTRWLKDERTGKRIFVKLGEPEEVDRDLWRCPYEIRRGGFRGVKYALGGDALQALSLAFQGIRINLDSIRGGVSWLGESLDLAFPRMIPYFGSRRFTQKLHRIVDRETRLFVAELEKKARGKRRKRSGKAG